MFDSTYKRLWKNAKGRPTCMDQLLRETLVDEYLSGNETLLKEGWINKEDLGERLADLL
jgi:hypothetical protein